MRIKLLFILIFTPLLAIAMEGFDDRGEPLPTTAIALTFEWLTDEPSLLAAACIENPVTRQWAEAACREIALGEKKCPSCLPVLNAANAMEDPHLRHVMQEVCNAFGKVFNPIVQFLHHEGPEKTLEILRFWQLNPDERPIVTSSKWDTEKVLHVDGDGKEDHAKHLETFLKEDPIGTQNQPILVSDGYHEAVMRFSYDAPTKKLHIDFWDPFEPHSRADFDHFMLQRIQEILDFKIFGEDNKDITVSRHYTRHQPARAFGECSVYASIYKAEILAGQAPETLTQGYVDRLVKERRAAIRSGTRNNEHKTGRNYFAGYDAAFNLGVHPEFMHHLLREIASLPEDWMLPEELDSEETSSPTASATAGAGAGAGTAYNP